MWPLREREVKGDPKGFDLSNWISNVIGYFDEEHSRDGRLGCRNQQ